MIAPNRTLTSSTSTAGMSERTLSRPAARRGHAVHRVRVLPEATRRPRRRLVGVVAEVEPLHLVGAGELACVTGQGHLADVEDVGQVGDAEGHGRVLLHQQHRRALPVDLGDDLADLADDARREAERRLVEQQQLRAGHQRPADGQHLLLAAGQQAAALGAALLEDREQLEDPLLGLGLGGLVPAAHAAGPQVLLHASAGRRSAVPPGPGPDPSGRSAAGSRPARSVPSNCTEPDSTRPRCSLRVPEMVRSSVVFPAPLLPRTATTLPSGISIETPRTACTPP